MKTMLKNLKKNYQLILMCLPAIIFFFIFSYLTMPGIYIAFVKYNYTAGMFKSPFVGLDNFEFLFKSGRLMQLTINTFAYNLLFIVTGVIGQLAIAILLNEIANKTYRKITQSIMIFPHFVSYVLVGVLAYSIINYEYGTFNQILKILNLEPIVIYSTPKYWPFILTVTQFWKSVGYGSIVYFAAITGIDTGIIESASLDGVNAFQRIRYIILPHLRPTVIILLLFSLGGILRGNFALFYFLTGASNSILYDSTDIIETFVFRSLVTNFNFSSASAVSLYQSFFGFILIMSVNYVVKKIEPDYSLF